MTDGTLKKEKVNRPFYELPAHIKPCSKIIQETRMQLKYGVKLGNTELPLSNNARFSDRGSDFGGRGDGEYDGNRHVELPNICGATGIKPVETKRPFTPRDSVSLWGVSARKRPPSAITLSRLAIDETDEGSVPHSDCQNGNQMSESVNSAGFKRVSKVSLGKVPKLQSAIGKSSHSLDSATDILGGLDQGKTVEKTRLQLKSLSLQNERLASFYFDSEVTPGSVDRDYDTSCRTLIEESTLTRKTPRQAVDREKSPPEPLIEKYAPKNATSTSMLASPDESNDSIDSLESAIVSLQNLVSRFTPTADKSIRGQVITVLKKVRSFIREVHKSAQLKTKLLRAIFKLVERNQTDEDILFWASFVLLHCNITGNNLTTIFKMVFKASRSKEYWGIIKETEYLDVLMASFAQICPKTQTESMIYGYGTLKFICMDTPVLHRCIELDLIPIMTLHLKTLNNQVTTLKEIPESIFNGTFQLTSILRSVVGEDSSILDLVVRSGLLEELCNSLHWTIADIDVVSNIVRILSVISMDDMCCQVISRNEHFTEAIVKVLKLWMNKDDVMVRVTYCLGNLFAKSDEMRIKLFERADSLHLVLNLISFHVKKPTPISMDILVKTVRIIANWILNPSIGWEICDDIALSELLYSILLMNTVTEELLLCVISTMNNTSFYKDYNAVDDYTLRTAEYLFCNVITKDLEVKAEAMKVLGNLTRNPDVRFAACDYVDNVLHCLDEETDEELLCATCGVLINIIVDEKVKSEFIRLDGIKSLVNVLRSRDDLAVIMMASQILWNLTVSNMEHGQMDKYGICDEKKQEIRKLLLHKLESLHPNNNAPELSLYQAEFYHDFETVARGLLEKL